MRHDSYSFKAAIVALAMALFPGTSAAEPTVTETTYLGPFTGADAALHPANQSPRIEYYGTDLGWSYSHDGKLHFLFGDTNRTDPLESIGEHHDDAFGTIDLDDWPDPSRITPDNLPRIKLAQKPGSSQLLAMDPGVVTDGLKTPEGGFSNGDREFVLLTLYKPRACTTNAQCGSHLTCDTGLGYIGVKPSVEADLTLACADGSPGCTADTLYDDNGAPLTGSGLCADRTSSDWDDTPSGRVGGAAKKMLVGVRSTADLAKYTVMQEWLTDKFVNTALRTVQDFVPTDGPGHENQDYGPGRGSGGNQRVLLWGRPGFFGVAADSRSLALYFAYVDMPAGPDSPWEVHYYTGTDEGGVPQFSRNEAEAVPVDLDSTRPGVQAGEMHDIVQHMSIVWIDRLKKWVMFYGGGMTTANLFPDMRSKCGFLRVFAGPSCRNIVIGDGAIRMRSSDDPWGPWTPPQNVIVGGSSEARPPGGQYASGGSMHHPRCEGPDCLASGPFPASQDENYGFLYGVNIIEEWITPAGDGVDVIWNASTWNPYRVILLRTHIDP